MSGIIWNDYLGFGDSIYKRPFVKQLQGHDIFLYTPFPELYSDLKVKFCRPHTKLKTQRKNIDKHDALKTWTEEKPYGYNLAMSYTSGLSTGNVIEAMEGWVELESFDFTIPVVEEGIERAKEIISKVDKKVCILRLPSVRNEWACESRNPEPRYFQEIIDAYNDRFYFISIGDCGENEYLVGEYTGIDLELHNSQLSLWEAVNLMRLSDLIVSIPCFTLPLSIAYGLKAFFIYGGYVKHDRLIDKRMNLSTIGYIEPSPFCNCVKNNHNCNKEINGLLWRFDEYLHRVKLVP
jgi:hypothetical protein